MRYESLKLYLLI
jgi:hypothetical protein